MSYQDITQKVSKSLKTLHQDTPKLMQGFGQLSQAALEDGVLDKKTKELIALAIAVEKRCDDCIAFHTKALVKLGASLKEIEEVLGVAVMMGGGPSLMYSAHVIEAFNEFSNKSDDACNK